MSNIIEKDVLELIKELKMLLENHQIELPSLGDKITRNANSIINVRNKFAIQIYRGTIDHNKYSFHARHINTNTQLLRIDTGDVVHTNPDGVKIVGPHMHVYKEGYEIAYAIPFNIEDDNLVSVCKRFLDKLNIIDYPTIIQEYTINDMLN